MSLESPFVSIIVVNYNGKSFLRQFFASLLTIEYPKSKYEVIMLDNGSSDGSIKLVKEQFPWVQVIRSNLNLGFGGGNNLAVKSAKGQYFFFLNNDTCVTSSSLRNLVEAAISNPNAIIGSKLLLMNTANLIDYRGGRFTLNGRGFACSYRNKSIDEFEVFQTGYPCAASMFVKRDHFIHLAGFDEDYFACLDDTDLGWRAWLQGLNVICCPGSVVYHYSGGTSGRERLSPTKVFHGTKNAFVSILKNVEIGGIPKGAAIALTYDLLEFTLLMRLKKAQCIKEKLRAYKWVMKNLRSIIVKRQIVQRKRVVSDDWLRSRGYLAPFSEALQVFVRLLYPSNLPQYTEKQNAGD